MSQAIQSHITVRDALVTAIGKTQEYNPNAEVPPIAVLWPDGVAQWREVVPALRDSLPVLTLGEYDAEARTGPAIWIRAELARLVDEGVVPVIYLPGYSKDVLRNVEEAPNTIEPLAYLQYRGALFVQPNGKDWTIPAFLQNAQFGLGLDVDKSEATRSSIISAAPRLLPRPVQELRDHAGGIDADFLGSLLVTDVPRAILEWINDPVTARASFDDASWDAFSGQLRHKYLIHPEQDGPSAAARKLGEAKVGSHWELVWSRFAEAPGRYPNIPNMLRGAKPAGSIQQSLFALVETNHHWPQDNEDQENALRDALIALDGSYEQDARQRVIDLEAAHATRRTTVWAELGQSPLAFALQHLALIATRTMEPLPAGSIATMQDAYTGSGWEIDAAALDAIAEVSSAQDRGAVDAALHNIYTPWLWKTAVAFQEMFAIERPVAVKMALSVPAGTCVLFADGLRYDLAARLVEQLSGGGMPAELSAAIGPLPGVTPSAKPAQSPVVDRLIAGSGLDTRVAGTGTALNQTSFKKLLADAGWQFISRDGTGHPGSDARAWTEFGNIDEYGHAHPDDLPRQTRREVEKLRQRIEELIDTGWSRVMVITDHGWLLTPRPMEKTELPQPVTVVRKGRCARVSGGAMTHMQTLPWIWDQEVRIAIAPGISCFEDGKRYDHGGLSLQECVVPAITVSGRGGRGALTSVAISEVTWSGLRCTVEVDGATEGHMVDLRLQPGDASTSILKSVKAVEDGGARVVANDPDYEGLEAVVVVLNRDGTPVAQRTLIVGGDEA